MYSLFLSLVEMRLNEIGLDVNNIFYMPPCCEEHGIEMELDIETDETIEGKLEGEQ